MTRTIGGDGTLLNGATVLFLEDDVLINLSTAALLQEMGCDVRSCLRVEEAEDLLSAELPQLALLDINVNGRNSYGLAERLERFEVPVVFLTAYGNATARWQHKPICRKPIDPRQLKQLLITALTERCPGTNPATANAPLSVDSSESSDERPQVS